jgi:hypothetical protein
MCSDRLKLDQSKSWTFFVLSLGQETISEQTRLGGRILNLSPESIGYQNRRQILKIKNVRP